MTRNARKSLYVVAAMAFVYYVNDTRIALTLLAGVVVGMAASGDDRHDDLTRAIDGLRQQIDQRAGS